MDRYVRPLRISLIAALLVSLGACLLPLSPYDYLLAYERRVLEYAAVSAVALRPDGGLYLAVGNNEDYIRDVVAWQPGERADEIYDGYDDIVELVDLDGSVLIVEFDDDYYDADSRFRIVTENGDESMGTTTTYSLEVACTLSISEPGNAPWALIVPTETNEPMITKSESLYGDSHTFNYSSQSAVFVASTDRVFHLKDEIDQGSTPIWYHSLDPATGNISPSVTELTLTPSQTLIGPMILSPDETTIVTTDGTVLEITSGLTKIAGLPVTGDFLQFTSDGRLVAVSSTGSVEAWVGPYSGGRFKPVDDVAVDVRFVIRSENGIIIVGVDSHNQTVEIHEVPNDTIASVAGS